MPLEWSKMNLRSVNATFQAQRWTGRIRLLRLSLTCRYTAYRLHHVCLTYNFYLNYDNKNGLLVYITICALLCMIFIRLSQTIHTKIYVLACIRTHVLLQPCDNPSTNMWSQLDIDTIHLLYLSIGGFLCLFMLFSSFIKNNLYFGEANVAILVGAVLGPFAAKAMNPNAWAHFDSFVLEFSRVVIVIQCFALALELPNYYIRKHWRSLMYLVGPVVLFGWMVCSLAVWWMMPLLSWVQSMAIASCFNAIDPVLAATVVGRSKFAKRVPKHIRNLLLAESAVNDVTTTVSLGLSILLTRFSGTASQVAQSLFLYTIAYEVILAGTIGLLVGHGARYALKYADKHDSIDRQSFLVFYLMVALFCVGLGSIMGVDDVLMAFCAGYALGEDGWVRSRSEGSEVSSCIDLLLNLTFFVFLGAMIPWLSFNQPGLDITPWRLVIITSLVFLLRRIPIILTLKPLIPDIKTWREALFYGHFGPIGVGAIFSAALISSQPGMTGVAGNLLVQSPDDPLQGCLWPIITFVVFCSSVVHGSSVQVFRVGKSMTSVRISMVYSSESELEPTWMDRLPTVISQSGGTAKQPSEDAASVAMSDVTQEGSDADSNRHFKRQKWKYRHQTGGSTSRSANYSPRSDSGQTFLKRAEVASAGPSSAHRSLDLGLGNNGPEIKNDLMDAEVLKGGIRNQYSSDFEPGRITRKSRPVTAYHHRRSIAVEDENRERIRHNKLPDMDHAFERYTNRSKIPPQNNKSMMEEAFLDELQALDPKANIRIATSVSLPDKAKVHLSRTARDNKKRNFNTDAASATKNTPKGLVSSVDYDDEEETPAERRRREAALGISQYSDSSESEYSETERIPRKSNLKLVTKCQDEIALTGGTEHDAEATSALTVPLNVNSPQRELESRREITILQLVISQDNTEMKGASNPRREYEDFCGSEREVDQEEVIVTRDKGKGKRVSLDLCD